MELTAKTYAKINLTLDIIGKLDNGYHLVDMLMQSVSLYDTVKVKKTDMGIKAFSSNETLGGEEDITYKAAQMFFEESGIQAGAQITIEKNIPLAAGLGGGSSNAAAVLLLLNKLYNEPLNELELKSIALKLGADVPFFLEGGTSRAEGIGEKLTKLPNMPDCFIVIAKDGIKKSTKYMYSVVDSEDISLFRPNTAKAIKALEENNLDLLSQNIKNVFSAAWGRSVAQDILSKNNALSVGLSGSGPSYFAIYENREDAEKTLSLLKENNITAFLTVPTKKGIEIE